jgi:hypothetical protein
MKPVRSTIASVMLAIASFATIDQANAATIDTYSFTQGGYIIGDVDATLSGTFTGTVDSQGDIGLNDLSSISYTLTVPNEYMATGSGVTEFFFDTSGGGSSLDLVGLVKAPFSNFTVCVGLSAVFPPECGTVDTSGTVNGVLGLTNGSGIYYTSDLPTVSLISTVTETPSTPLPSTWTMLIAGIVALGFFAYRGTKKGAATLAAA